MLTAGGGLFYAGDADAALGFATGFLPTGFVVILRLAVVRCGASVRFFLAHLRRDCSWLLWWSAWNAAKDAAACDATGCLSDDAGDGDTA